ncbi:MAG: hypothetical protein FWE05_04120 [Defluviitaleaceae bacterium]|nr:hypothetical protein [Defluviitaleaceae bacterium]
MEKPKLSPDFTMEDLYSLREYNSLRRYGMTTEELIADIRQGADKGLAQIEQIRKEKTLATAQ